MTLADALSVGRIANGVVFGASIVATAILTYAEIEETEFAGLTFVALTTLDAGFAKALA